MASRDVTNFRTVTNQVVENKGEFARATASVAESVLRQGQEAKITQGISQAQLELSKLETQYRIDFEGNPMGGLQEYKESRQAIFDTIGEDISPIYKRQWEDSARQISSRNDATQQAWGLKQTRLNTIDSVNDSMANNFTQANNDGLAFALSDDSEIESFVNYGTSLEALESFTEKNLGSETAEKMLDTYEEDYLKSFISGVSEKNPHKALALVDSDFVVESFTDREQLGKFKKSLQARVTRFDKANKQKEDAFNMAGTNSLLPKIGKMGYAELQANFSEFNMSPEARGFYEEVNGYSNMKRKMSPEEKAEGKNKFNIFLSEVIGKDDLTNGDIKILQDSVYAGMRKNVLSKNQGFGLLNEILQPVLEQQQERAEQFETGEWNPFQENLGLETLSREVTRLSGNEGRDFEKLTPEQQFNDNKNRNMMYDVYLQTLSKEAANRNTSVAGLSTLPFEEEQKIYNKALTTAKETFIRSKFPSLAGQKDLPATVVTPISNVNLTDADIDNMSEAELDKFLASQ